MKFNLSLIISILIVVGIVALGFTVYQATVGREKLDMELEKRIDDVIKDINLSKLNKVDQTNIEKFSDSINTRFNLAGIALFHSADSIICNSSARRLTISSFDYVYQALVSDTTVGNYFKMDGKKIYRLIKPVTNAEMSRYALIVFSDASYIDNIIGEIWVRNFLRWFLQALFVSIVTMLIIRFRIFSPINKTVTWVKEARVGEIEELSKSPPAPFLAPLHKEVVEIAKAMQSAKASAEEEARLRSSAESIWTAERLKVEVENLMYGKKMIVVSNREPYMHIHEGKNIRCIVPASGMITAMEPILKSCGGLWIASGSGDADKISVDENDKLQVPPDDPKYTLRRVWLTKEEEDHYYYGFSNEGLWPLCHIAHTRPVFRKEDWDYYQKVNQHFADSVLEETLDDEEPFILIQDYHFALLPQLIKKEKPNAKVAIFWHIPWPNPESFGICPWQREILMGMLGADLVGFHTQYHCNHFLETVNNALESRVIWDNFTVKMKGHTTVVKPFPISIDFTTKDFDSVQTSVSAVHLLNEHGINAELMGIGVDRIDYTKGIVEKFLAVERFFEKNPEYIGEFTFVQIGAPSRTLLKNYADIMNVMEHESNRINWRFKKKNWTPILFLKRHHSHEEIYPYYASANFCMVTSLHDGMNLVAKEFIASRNNNDGVLILSRFAGAANDLHGAIIVNPYDIEKSADAIKHALTMTVEDQNIRMKQMRQSVVVNNIYAWASSLIKSMINI